MRLQCQYWNEWYVKSLVQFFIVSFLSKFFMDNHIIDTKMKKKGISFVFLVNDICISKIIPSYTNTTNKTWHVKKDGFPMNQKMNKLPYSLKYEYYHGVIQDLHSFYLTPTFDVNGFMKTHEHLIFSLDITGNVIFLFDLRDSLH